MREVDRDFKKGDCVKWGEKERKMDKSRQKRRRKVLKRGGRGHEQDRVARFC